jgi:hypothetical protein
MHYGGRTEALIRILAWKLKMGTGPDQLYLVGASQSQLDFIKLRLAHITGIPPARFTKFRTLFDNAPE